MRVWSLAEDVSLTAPNVEVIGGERKFGEGRGEADGINDLPPASYLPPSRFSRLPSFSSQQHHALIIITMHRCFHQVISVMIFV